MTTEEVAKQLVALCQKGEFTQAMEKLYAENIVSLEPFDRPGAPMPREIRNLEMVRKKAKWWEENHTMHSCAVGGPFVAQDKFAVTFDLDATFKPANKRMQMSEVAVYTVANGKIVHEEFLFKNG
jgi:ketosteroid isomerase-like protein